MKPEDRFKQSDLLFITLTDAGRNKHIETPVKGWFTVFEVAVDGGILSGNFAPNGSKGYGHVYHPKFELHILVRGKHGELSPYAALKKLEELAQFTDGDQAQYKLELPGSAVELFAKDDAEAKIKADKYLTDHRVTASGLKLFRYPKEWVNQPTKGLVEVPFYRLKS